MKGNRFLRYVTKDRKSPRENRERVGQNLMILAIALFFIFVVNFIVIVGTDRKFGQKLSVEAKNVYQTTVKVQAKRGTIYDRDGNAIAEDATTYTIYAIISKSYKDSNGKKLYVQPSQYKTVATILNEQLGIEKKEVLKQLKQKKLFQVFFGVKGKGISYTTMTAIEESMKKANVSGIGFETSPGRTYPNGIFASQFVGYAQLEDDTSGSQLVGKTGLEASFNTTLSGTDGYITYEKDSNGNTLLGSVVKSEPAINGKDIYTTLSEPLQTLLEGQLDAFQSQVNAKNITATLVNAKTGEILATAQRPTYNPTDPQTYNDLSNKNDLLYQTYFEPGSTMKVMTLASAIDSGVFNTTEYYYSNKYEVGDVTVRDWDVNEGRTDGLYMNFVQGFAHSSNVGMSILEGKMGDNTWFSYLSKFRFGYPTRFGMLNEDGGLFPSLTRVNGTMTSFGQAIGVTRVQMIRAFLAISNDGVMLEPRFIRNIHDPNTDTNRTATTEVVGKPVSKNAASQTRDYMVTVGTDATYGTLVSKGQPIIQAGNQTIAVKSGTAQIAENGSYLTGPNDTINSVIAMVPSDNPDFLMYVTLQQPKSWFGTEWSTLVNPVLEQALAMKDTLTTSTVKQDKSTKYTLPNIIGKNPGDTAVVLRQNIVQPVILGNGSKISKSSKATGRNLSENEQILLLTDKLTELPDMYGWTKKNVKIFAKWTGIDLTVKGKKSGTVIKQSVESGKSIKKVKKLTITLGD
ncbi:penicillin-binding protein PBP2X [Streptococcus sciuri]|uniref:Penicillin-binding protein PBP2X n=1 Tax=Streptococcus sciuri TaxID=2973939 RepID=A0ABT2F801_9STRE|nr:penicillin-binding protein PBP2X [Streptococcus sciuri]MCS4488620.1 penicillin-binding protein PBP2X [Streptococcus sciuri]